jgi:glutamine amidotransferase
VAGSAAELPVTDLLTLDAPRTPRCCGRWSATACGPATTRGRPRGCRARRRRRGPGSRLNLLLTDGAAVWATTWTHALSVRVGAGAVVVASEPCDGSGGWVAVPDRHLVVATPQRCDIHPLDADAPTPPSPSPPVTDPAPEPRSLSRPPRPRPRRARPPDRHGCAPPCPCRPSRSSSEGVA